MSYLFMRSRTLVFSALATILLSACEYWPEDLKPLAESVSRQVSGETTAWRVGGNIVAINVADSPLYWADLAVLETTASDIAAQAVAFTRVPLESVSVTFHENEVSEDAEEMREFIFIIVDNKPVLQPLLYDDATGPLKPAEIEALFLRTGKPLAETGEKCVINEVAEQARAAGDPETLDPSSVEFLPVKEWGWLDPFERRLMLAQAIATRALFVCGEPGETRTP